MLHTVDVTGLGTAEVALVEELISQLKQKTNPPIACTDRTQWRLAIREWAENHPSFGDDVDWNREGIYAGRGE